jgi:hypothetical protein
MDEKEVRVMHGNEVVLGGVVTPEGTLQVSGKVALPPGKVEVTVRSVPETTAGEDWWQFMQRARRELEAAGHRFVSDADADADAHLEWLREGDRIDDLLREVDRDRSAC